METLFEIAKKILDANGSCSLTGTLMLKIRGIDLGREPKDIDILIYDYAEKINFPFEVEEMAGIMGSDGSSVKFKYGDVIIDVLSDGERPEEVDGWRLGTLDGLMKAKYAYSKNQNDPQSEKHYNDLVKLGFDFEKARQQEYRDINDLFIYP